MVFSSTIFLFGFLAVTIPLYYITPLRWRNWVLFGVSLLFYGFGEPRYIVIMMTSVLVAYLTGFPIGKYRTTNPRRARAWLVVSLVLNLAFLLFFKYTNFFIENLRLIPALTDRLAPIEGLTLPIGISFYTF
jgi:alginate O-acetyltransferase complex protein AlgI